MTRSGLVRSYLTAIREARKLADDVYEGRVSGDEAYKRLPYLEGNQKRLDDINSTFNYPTTYTPERLDDCIAAIRGAVFVMRG